ncbi:hypothetical protein HU830_04920 [Lactobacillus sp. DCY120]|uniref:Uncharacterized protein n=1 Tax=Bombilactobacillus apium TaxID=2675299 RepID=A0A850R0C9_9LACO|nr:hypothetical protein [Bombilactobacillus apium]NVY96509.1 hypothetical protein [Bombilactobacillus apium]
MHKLNGCGISSILETNGYVATMFDSDADIQREQRLMATVDSHTFDALIIQPFSSVAKINATMR